MISKKLNKVIASVILVAMLFTTFPVAFANADKYPAYEFVITADKTSVKTGDVLTITVTTNGPLANASMIQYQIVFNPQQFKTTTARKTALDSTWFSGIEDGENFGAISTKPQLGLNPKTADLSPNATQQIFSLVFVDSAVSGETDDGEAYSLFVPESNTETTAVAGKILFTALTDIADVSDCFTVINAKNEYADETGSLKDNLTGTIVQLSETMAVQKVINLIDGIGSPVTYSSKAKIEEAKAAYNAITKDSLKAQVTNLPTLTAAEQALGVIIAKMESAKDLIDGLDSTSETFETDIAAAETAFNALDIDAQAALTGYKEKIQSAKDTLAAIKKEAEDKAAAKVVEDKIEKLFPVTLESGDAISEAQKAYDNLTQDQRTHVGNYAKIEEARQKLKELEELKKTEEDKAAAKPVVDAIESLFPITLDSGVAIAEAEAAYEALTDDQKAHVTNYAKISEAKEKLNTLIAQKEAAEEVSALIADIPEEITKDNVVEARNAIDSAKTSYDALGEAKDLVPAGDVAKLETALETIVVVEKAVKDAANMDKAIDLLYPVTLNSGNAISKAEEDFIALSSLAQSYVTKGQKLTEAREIYDALVEEENEVQRIIGLIDSLGSADDIDYGTYADILADAKAVKEELDTLDSTLIDRSRVTNRNTLTEIIDKCLEIQESQKRIDNVVEKIGSLGEITLNSATDIDVVRGLYEELSDIEKAMVGNYNVLKDAEDTLAQLEAEAEQEEIDRNKAAAVDLLIEKIGDVSYTSESWKLISEAKQAYNALTDDQKGYVENFEKLDTAEKTYLALEADFKAVDEVIKAIDKIGLVEYTQDSLERIQTAENLYLALEERLKDQVKNAYMIDIAKANYESKKKDYEAVQEVIGKIDGIGDIDYTKETFELLTAIQNAFDALSEELQKNVTNKQDLLDAWETYNSMKPVVSQKNDVVGYDGKHLTVVTNVPADMTVSFGTAVASVVDMDGVIYHVLITEEEISKEDVIVTDVAAQKMQLGNVVGNDSMITAMDAQATNQVAAKNTVDVFETDPMAFIRADVNGDGKISVMDALMIAKYAAGDDVKFRLAVGMIVPAE